MALAEAMTNFGNGTYTYTSNFTKCGSLVLNECEALLVMDGNGSVGSMVWA